MSRTNTLGNHKATAPRTSHTRYPKGLLQVLQGSSTQGSLTLMGARQSSAPVTMLSSMTQSLVLHRGTQAALPPWQTVTCTLWCQTRRPFCFLLVRVSQQVKEKREIKGRREEIPFFWFPPSLVISHIVQELFALYPIKCKQGCR